MKTYKLMVFDGKDYNEEQSSDDLTVIDTAFKRHQRVMPNCPCLIEVSYVMDSYEPA